MSVEFKSLKKQYIEQGKLHDETSKAFNAKSSQLETMSQDLVAARQELETKQHMMTELQNELAAAQVQVNKIIAENFMHVQCIINLVCVFVQMHDQF